MERLAFLFLLTASVVGATTPTASDVVAGVEKNLAPDNFQALYAFTNYRTDGTVMNYEVRFSVKDVDHAHGYFLKPEREKGREILRLGDAIWTFIPGAGRIVRIADRESFAGGDFSNADVLRVDWLKHYKAQFASETEKQWIIDLSANSSDASYAKMRLWVEKKTAQPLQQYFYDSKGTLLKRLLYGSVRDFGKLSRPARLIMENVFTTQKTELKVLDMNFSVNIPENRFFVDRLGK
ncbi:MAG: outer membrane lipoprotein-sorting protein [Deltaproteobacteria bacterium]|nr:outer membrane lipoprotein-sorting protein [Deltaproteobacteria bacterium]